MHQVFLAYLQQSKELYLPDLGLWQIEPQGAHYDVAAQTMHPPGFGLNWQPPHLVEVVPLQPLLGFISRQTGEPEETCYDKFQQTLNAIQVELKQNGEATLPGLGKLFSLNKDALTFVPDKQVLTRLPALHAPRVSHEGRPHQIQVGDRQTDTLIMQQELHTDKVENLPKENTPQPKDRLWWIAPLIAGLIALGFIVAKLRGWVG